jgi:large subunit ribosomal protein L3
MLYISFLKRKIDSNYSKKIYNTRNVCQKSAQNTCDFGCFGTKAGMTTYFLASGEALPCSVISVEETNIVSQVKSVDKDGYHAVQISYGQSKEKNMSKPEIYHLKKVGSPSLRHSAEFKIKETNTYLAGEKLSPIEKFKKGDLIDVKGSSIGKGFQGGIKRWKMHRGYMTHGSKSHRAPGSIGMRYSGGGGRVLPGLKMPGHLGNKRLTVRKLQVIDVIEEHNAIIVKGSVPGKPGSVLQLIRND